MQVQVIQASPFRIQTSFIQKLFRVIGQHLPRYDHAVVSVAFVDNREMKKLNTRYRHRPSVTDVLSFAERDSRGVSLEPGYVGEIIIAYPYARRQAAIQGVSIRRELVWLLAHGFLHLIGYDHHRPADQRRMQSLEQKIISSFEHR
ncbi:MAG: rRNA maturation RNase YbeY [Patescibacteria group bacterium]